MVKTRFRWRFVYKKGGRPVEGPLGKWKEKQFNTFIEPDPIALSWAIRSRLRMISCPRRDLRDLVKKDWEIVGDQIGLDDPDDPYIVRRRIT